MDIRNNHSSLWSRACVPTVHDTCRDFSGLLLSKGSSALLPLIQSTGELLLISLSESGVRKDVSAGYLTSVVSSGEIVSRSIITSTHSSMLIKKFLILPSSHLTKWISECAVQRQFTLDSIRDSKLCLKVWSNNWVVYLVWLLMPRLLLYDLNVTWVVCKSTYRWSMRSWYQTSIAGQAGWAKQWKMKLFRSGRASFCAPCSRKAFFVQIQVSTLNKMPTVTVLLN